MIATKKKSFAGIQYVGSPGITQDCIDAVMRLVQYDDRITRVRILSHSQEHCLLLTIDENDLFAIKAGFSSGYMGEGPRGFSLVLRILEDYGAEIEEFEVGNDFIE